MAKTKTESELESIRATGLWKEYSQRAFAFRDTMINDLLTCPIEKVEMTRGIITGLNYLLRLPEKIVEDSKNKNGEGE